MGKTSKKKLWKFREAANVSNIDQFVIFVLFIAGVISVLQFADWWFREDHISNLPMFIALSLFIWYSIFRIVLIWTNYLRVKKPQNVPAPPEGLRVAIFTTSSPGEPLSMFDKTLEALSKVKYPHTTYLLDDTQDPAFKALAEKHGAVWMELVGLPGAKAGKINAALKKTTEDFILILDPDHIAFPNFLHQTLGFFQDEKVGFVQVSQAYYNQYRSFTAAGAAEQTYTFYGGTQMGFYGHESAVAIGANCTFRRKALESIGGHGIGLAEDLITSLRIHAAGWKSIYNPVIVSRGLVPEDMGSFCKQQLKWARGTFEVLFAEVPKVFSKLTLWQKLIYCSIGSYYFVGTTTLFFLLVPFLYFFTGIIPGKMSFVDFIIKGAPIILIAALIYFYAQRFLCHPEAERGFHWRGMILKYASWPVFFLGFILSVINKEIPYIPTAKKAAIGSMTPFVRPLAIYCVVFLATLAGVYIQRRYFIPESQLIFTSERVWAMLGFAALVFFQSVIGLFAAYEAVWLKDEEPWKKVDLSKISTP